MLWFPLKIILQTPSIDNLIYHYYTTSVDEIENIINKDISKTTYKLTISESVSKLTVDIGNLISISAITNGLTPITEYSIYKNNNYFEIDFDTSSYDDLEILFITGYEDEKIPASINNAIFIKTMDYYDGERMSIRPESIKILPTIDRILSPYKKRYSKYE